DRASDATDRDRRPEEGASGRLYQEGWETPRHKRSQVDSVWGDGHQDGPLRLIGSWVPGTRGPVTANRLDIAGAYRCRSFLPFVISQPRGRSSKPVERKVAPGPPVGREPPAPCSPAACSGPSSTPIGGCMGLE